MLASREAGISLVCLAQTLEAKLEAKGMSMKELAPLSIDSTTEWTYGRSPSRRSSRDSNASGKCPQPGLAVASSFAVGWIVYVELQSGLSGTVSQLSCLQRRAIDVLANSWWFLLSRVFAEWRLVT